MRSVSPDDPSGFSAFYREARPSCVRATVVTVCDIDRAEEYVDEAFALAYERWRRVRRHPNPQGWIVRTAVNLSRKQWHRRNREDDLTPPASLVPPPMEPMDEKILDALLALPERQREVIAHRIVLQASTKEAAEALDIAPSTVTVHLHRAMRALREHPDVRAMLPESGVG